MSMCPVSPPRASQWSVHTRAEAHRLRRASQDGHRLLRQHEATTPLPAHRAAHDATAQHIAAQAVEDGARWLETAMQAKRIGTCPEDAPYCFVHTDYLCDGCGVLVPMGKGTLEMGLWACPDCAHTWPETPWMNMQQGDEPRRCSA